MYHEEAMEAEIRLGSRCFEIMIWTGYVVYLLMNSNQQQTG